MENETVFWADSIAKKLIADFPGEQVVQDEKTPSGRIHLGSLRGFVLHQILFDALKDAGAKARFLLGSDDYDELDKIPAYWKDKVSEKWLGAPLCNVPSPSGNHSSYAEEVRSEVYEHFDDLGLSPELYNTSDKYKDGTFNEATKTALENAEKINEINRKVSGADKKSGHLPFKPICPSCGKINTSFASDFDGKTVAFECKEYKGCNEKGRISPYDGKGKLPWKVEWAAKWKAFQVTCEYAGKDHFTKGGSHDVSVEIAKQVYNLKPPYGEGYEFVLLGKKKMSSSGGVGETAADILKKFSPKMIRFLFVKSRPSFQLPFDPSGQEVPRLFDEYDKIERVYFGLEKESNEREVKHLKRVYELSHAGKLPAKTTQVNFSFATALVQVAKGKEKNVLQKLGHLPKQLDAEEEKLTEQRLKDAKNWVEHYAPEDFKINVLKDIPKVDLSEKEKELFLLTASKLTDGIQDEELQNFFYNTCKEKGLNVKEAFGKVYALFLGKNRGPRLGPFLSSLEKDFAVKRLKLEN
ncbi:MAG: lysine--tRNA ligase [Candidatus Micrarchaeia archaeon]